MRKPKAKACHHFQVVIKPKSKFQLSGYYHFILHDTIPQPILDNFYGSRDFTKLPKLISKFQDKNGTELKSNLKEFIAMTQHTKHANSIKTCIASANVLCRCIGSITSKYPCTTVLI